ncbi:uncharacterized protein LOC143276228 [Babylonia areolata]|uniref:uncharacterized protein LOC143276228 n=1 Tax=Babylonia areolata TaxID=304850 RepID=UPI003FD31544
MRQKGSRQSDVCRMIWMLLVLPKVTATSCDELQCLNSNPCQSFVTRDHATQAQCTCGGKWAGPRCQYQLRLEMEAVTSLSVRLRLDLTASSQNDDLKTRPASEEASPSFVYTLVYWRSEKSVTSKTFQSFPDPGHSSCLLLHGLQSRQPTLQGLQPSTQYVACVESGSMDSCALSSFFSPAASSTQNAASWSSASSSWDSTSSVWGMSSWPSNCVTFKTSGTEPMTGVLPLVFISVFSGAVFVVTVITVVVILVRRKPVSTKVMECCLCPELCFSSKRRCCISSSRCFSTALCSTRTSNPASRAVRSRLVEESVPCAKWLRHGRAKQKSHSNAEEHPLVSARPTPLSHLPETSHL